MYWYFFCVARILFKRVSCFFMFFTWFCFGFDKVGKTKVLCCLGAIVLFVFCCGFRLLWNPDY